VSGGNHAFAPRGPADFVGGEEFSPVHEADFFVETTVK
jgi:hypothetical protein